MAAQTTALQTALTSNTNIIMSQVQVIRDLIKKYVPGFGDNTLRGVLTLNDLPTIPICMIQPVSTSSIMSTLAKYHRIYTFDIYYWVGNDNVEQVTRLVTDAGEIFEKLFSNNALNDIGAGGGGSANFKLYSPNWINSEMSGIRYGPALKAPVKPGRPKYAALGYFQLKTEKVFIT